MRWSQLNDLKDSLCEGERGYFYSFANDLHMIWNSIQGVTPVLCKSCCSHRGSWGTKQKYHVAPQRYKIIPFSWFSWTMVETS